MSTIDSKQLFCITYPRHGSHFLRENLTQEVDNFDIIYQHRFDNNNAEILEDSPILTVVRNPIDAIASKLVLSLERNESHKNVSDSFEAKEMIEQQLSRIINSYSDTYHKLNEYKNLMVVDFTTFETNPWWAFNYIFKTLGSDKELTTFAMPQSDEVFIATSKDNQYYQYCRNEVSKHEGIDRAFRSYELLSQRLYEYIDLN
jgi:hypothetical protein